MLKIQQVAATLLLTSLLLQNAYAQRVAPGVNPQHYQQVPVQQHPQQPQHHQQQQQPQQQHQQYQQPPQQQVHVAPGVPPQHYQAPQYQQVPVQQQQYQQAPVQQQPQQPQVVPQQQVHQQQQQVPHGASHGHAHGQQQVLNAGNIQDERAHIQEHMQVPIDTSKMSEAELQFHYFKMHDSDNNNKLDGCELIKSLIHWHADEKKPDQTNNSETGGTGVKDGIIYTDTGLSDVIDYVLKTMDLNNDGYVDYAEYRKSEGKVGQETN